MGWDVIGFVLIGLEGIDIWLSVIGEVCGLVVDKVNVCCNIMCSVIFNGL